MAVRAYELLVLLDPARSEEERQQTLDKIDEVITKYGGSTDRRETLGKKRLAYSIGGRRDGYYELVYFSTATDAEVLNEVERFCKYDEVALRHMLTLAVVGKSKGDPSKAPEERPREYSPRGGPRGPRRDDRNDRGGERPAPAVTAPAATTSAAPAPAAESTSE